MEESERQVSARSVQPDWCRTLTLQQQSVLLLASRGPDGVAKYHPCKKVQVAYRGCVLVAARTGRELAWGESSDAFMSLREFADDTTWAAAVYEFIDHHDSIPHHFTMHLMHGAEILAYKHPDSRFRDRWLHFYLTMARVLHMNPETEEEMDRRLNDWGREGWQ